MAVVDLRPLHTNGQAKLPRLFKVGLCSALLVGAAGSVGAQNLPTIHWPRTQPEISPPVINSLPAEMAADLQYVVAAWNQSPYVHTAVQTKPQHGDSCNPVLGAMRFCVMNNRPNFPAGTQTFYTGDGHLIAARGLVSDEFIFSPPYNTTSGRRAVFCYEMGVMLGVPEQDRDPFNPDITDASGQQSCLDASPTPDGNENPTPVDFVALAEIYEHSHTDFGVRDFSGQNQGQAVPALPSSAQLDADLGKVTRVDGAGKPIQFERVFANGVRVVTRVTGLR